MLGLFLRTLERIYQAALYSYATEGVIPEAFHADELDEIWEVADPSPTSTDHESPTEYVDASAVERAEGSSDEEPSRDG